MGIISKLALAVLMGSFFITTCWADSDYTLLSKNESEFTRGVKTIEINIVVPLNTSTENLEAILRRLYLRQEPYYPNVDIKAYFSVQDSAIDDYAGFLKKTKSVSDEPEVVINEYKYKEIALRTQ